MSSPLASLLPDPESIAAVRAIHDTYGREVAVLILQEFQSDFIVSARLHAPVEGVPNTPVTSGSNRVEGYHQGRLI